MEANKKDSFDPKAIKPFKPIRALVLPGGGGRGAYQVGVVKACSKAVSPSTMPSVPV